jgi:hypothetical protein
LKRRRGDEYKAPLKLGRNEPIEDSIAKVEQAPEAVRKAAEAKAKKGYRLSALLIIYLNIPDHGIRQKETEDPVTEAKNSSHVIRRNLRIGPSPLLIA